jgi:hypothetical protein
MTPRFGWHSAYRTSSNGLFTTFFSPIRCSSLAIVTVALALLQCEIALATNTVTRVIRVSSVAAGNREVTGEDLDTGKTFVVKVSSGAPIHGRAGIGDITPGDIAYAYGELVGRGELLASSVDVNVITFEARLTHLLRRIVDFALLDDHTLQPQPGPMYPRYLGIAPTTLTLGQSTRISKSGQLTDFQVLSRGEIVKVYGYKPPSSSHVDAFLVEIQRR